VINDTFINGENNLMELIKQRISYGLISLILHSDAKLLKEMCTELEPFFEFDSRNSSDPILNFFIHSRPFTKIPTTPGERILIDTSLYKHLASEGMRWGNEKQWLIRIDSTNSWLQFDAIAKTVEMFQEDTSLQSIDGIRFIKGVVTSGLEKTGAIQIHSSGVVIDGKAVLLFGDMWQGKTTLLLELLSKFNVSQLSCDTVCLCPNKEGGIEARGWPSPFSMSHGTMLDHKELHPFIPDSRLNTDYSTLWKEGKKTVLTTQQIVDLFNTDVRNSCGHVSLCLVVKYSPGELTQVSEILTEEELISYLHIVYLGSRDPIYHHNWHGYIDCGHDIIESNIRSVAKYLIDNSEVKLFTWAPSAESMMKSIPLLSSAHKDIGSLFPHK
jgi:hypothetical protein